MTLSTTPREPTRARAASSSPGGERRGIFTVRRDLGWTYRPAHPRGRRMLGPLGVGVAGVAAAVLLHFVDPRQPGNYPTCPFLALTGYQCPGCGSMRACASLTDLDVAAAFGFNPLLPIAVVVLSVTFALWTRRRWRGEPRTSAVRPWVVWTLLVVVLAFWVLRNLPQFSWIAPLA